MTMRLFQHLPLILAAPFFLSSSPLGLPLDLLISPVSDHIAFCLLLLVCQLMLLLFEND